MTTDPLNNLDEQVIIDGILAKDGQALSLFLQIYGPNVKGWLIGHYGNLLQEIEIDEAMNVAAWRVWQYCDKFDLRKGHLKGWFLKIAQRAAIDILNQESSHSHESLRHDPESQDGDEIPLDDAKKRLLDDLDEIIKQLPPLQRAIVDADLAVGGSADNERLARLNNTSRASISVSRCKARETIRSRLLEPTHTMNLPIGSEQ